MVLQHPFELGNLSTTKRLATQVATFCQQQKPAFEQLNQGIIITLSGSLGSGKTTFCRYLINALQPQQIVPSPSYSLVNTYADWIYHLDCYRLTTSEELEFLGVRENLVGANLFIVEWPSMVGDYFSPSLVDINLTFDHQQRQIDFIITLNKNPILRSLQQQLNSCLSHIDLP